MYLLTDILWDIDQDNDKHQAVSTKLPTKLVVSIEQGPLMDEEELEDNIGEILAANFGLAHKGFKYEPIDVLM